MYTRNDLAYNPKSRAMQALYANDIKYFLKEFFTFRMHITFKKPMKPGAPTKMHFYGNEHKCTLNQVLAGYVNEIPLDKYKGLNGLIESVEKTWKGKWTGATIYMRDAPGVDFTTIVRNYYNGSIQEEQSPVLDDPIRKVFYHGRDLDRLPLFKMEPFASIDFKKEIEEHLLKGN